jgi:hypothetical protein
MDANVPANFDVSHRTKPWGTGHALLCASDCIHEPFAVINADDYYGPLAFIQAFDFLTGACNPNRYAIVGYQLDKTLSDHGTVSRGVCEIDAANNLISIRERTKISRREDSIVYEENDEWLSLDGNSSVSMNFWCFHHRVFKDASILFNQFLAKQGVDAKAEFFIPILADVFIQDEGSSIQVIPTTAEWFGVTYKEDAPLVKERIDQLISSGVYPESLWC